MGRCFKSAPCLPRFPILKLQNPAVSGDSGWNDGGKRTILPFSGKGNGWVVAVREISETAGYDESKEL